MSFQGFTIRTCENMASGHTSHPLQPKGGEDLGLFEVHDPFNIRKAVLPVFWLDAQSQLTGLGTSFASDPWGNFISAHHVLDNAQGRVSRSSSPEGNVVDTYPDNEGFVVFLPHGVIFGRMGLPPKFVAHVVSNFTPGVPVDNPMAQLTGNVEMRPVDIAFFKANLSPEVEVQTLPIRGMAPTVHPGEIVVALGYPELDTFSGDVAEARQVISEGMKVAYGRVRDAFPEGRGSDPTPVFEVEANWPSGMSGGPVLNSAGEVVGIVSRSLAPDETGQGGVGWAVWLSGLYDISRWAPTLSQSNPCWRNGWAVMRDEPWTIFKVFETEALAAAFAAAQTGTWEVRFGGWRIGSDDFISETT